MIELVICRVNNVTPSFPQIWFLIWGKAGFAPRGKGSGLRIDNYYILYGET